MLVLPVGQCNLALCGSGRRQHRTPSTSSVVWPARSRLGKGYKAGKRDTRRQVAETREAETEEVQIEGLDKSYCDDFVCTSSPQVEQNVRALAREIVRVSTWNTNLFRKDVAYRDPCLSFSGIENYGRLKFVKEAVNKQKVLVTQLAMTGRGSCEVKWQLRGNVGPFPILANCTSSFKLDLITGRVFEHKEAWDLSRSSAQARAAYSMARRLWSAKFAVESLKESGVKLLDSMGNDNDSQKISADPTDPTKFFQQDDTFMKDAFSLATILAFLYVMIRAWFFLESR